MKMTKGRQKIEIKKIEEINSRQIAFSKRRTGLFKKASEICVLTGAQVAILVSSPGGRIFAFGHPHVDVLFDRYEQNATTNNTTESGTTKSSQPPPPLKEFNQHYVEVSRELETEKKRGEMISVSSSRSRWFEEPVDGVLDVEEYLFSLEELKKKILKRADELTKSSAACFGSNVYEIEGGSNFQYGGDDGGSFSCFST